MSDHAQAGDSVQKNEGRPEEDAESVFSDSEEEEGELLGGRRDVASDAGDEDDADKAGAPGTAADQTAERLGNLSLGAVARTVAAKEEGSTSEEGEYEDGERQEGYESELEEEDNAESEEKPAPQSRPARKVLEPFEVPMSGTFWMHDDRGGDEEEEGLVKRRPKKKLYEPDDDGEKWQHDRFELLEMPPEYDQYRGFLQESRSRGRGRGRQGRQEEENAPPPGEGFEWTEIGNGSIYHDSQYDSSARGGGRGRRGGRGRGRGRAWYAGDRQQEGWPEAGEQPAQAAEMYNNGPRSSRGRRGGRGRGRSSYHRNGEIVHDGSSQQGRGGRGRGRQGRDVLQEEWPSLPGSLQASASGSKLNATAKDFTPPVSEHDGAPAAVAEAAAQLQAAQPGAEGQLLYRPYVPQPMPAPKVAYGVPVGPGFVPGPMQQGAGYAADAAMQRPVKRPVTIQAPPESQQTTAPFPAPQDGGAARQQHNGAPQAVRGRGGRRYSAMAGNVSTS